jgi:hypothetical protein
MISTMKFYVFFQMFKSALLFLSAGGDGVPFSSDSLVGYLTCSLDCSPVDMAVPPVYAPYFTVFFLVFCHPDDT